jgi:predicted AAA+ superfamily ATPase
MNGRLYGARFRSQSAKPYVSLLFGARQTGKSTLLHAAYPHPALSLDFANPVDRAEFGLDPSRFIQTCRAFPKAENPAVVLIDEAQLVPEIFNAVQSLYDSDKSRWRFILCGSSARKLRKIGANLLPGRSLYHRLYPLVQAEISPGLNSQALLPLPDWAENVPHPFAAMDLASRLAYGALPGIVSAPVEDRADLLKSYAAIYLEEEVRREVASINLGHFSRFLELAALESGQIVNSASIAQRVGVAGKTIQSYYSILEDMFIGFSLPAFSGSVRQGLLSTPRFYFFDLGVRHAAAHTVMDSAAILANPGPFFEQWVGMELWKRLGYQGEGKLSYFRTKSGIEVDFILEQKGKLTPIEVKWTDRPTLSDARHLKNFLADNPKAAARGYIVCRCQHPLELAPNIHAIPWQNL